jgi:phosphoglycerol transferase MdoB-like AlkP superfamily enzyme
MLERIGSHHLFRQHPNLTFWSSFLLLNGLLFLPLYLFSMETSTLLPSADRAAGDPVAWVSQFFVWRDNLDPLRLSVEFTLLTALWLFVRRLHTPLFQWLFTIFYLLALAYYIYEAIVVSIYLSAPVFYSQYFLARDGLPFLFSHLQTGWWMYVAAVAGVVAAVVLLVAIVGLMLRSAVSPALHRVTRIAVGLLAAICVAMVGIYQPWTATPEMIVSSLGYKLQQNIAASVRLQADIAGFDDSTIQVAYSYPRYELAKKPDIYIIAVESYGSVLYKRPDFRLRYGRLLDDVTQRLGDGGWQMSSALSESPTWGGGSWLAYTSLLFGLRVDNHPQYLSLLNRYSVQPYPNLGRTLKALGYRYEWLSSLVDKWDEPSWAKYIRFHGPDEVLRYEDLNFKGPRYGWGPAVPDQYGLNYAEGYFRKQADSPRLFFTITQNSHYPWAPHPELVEDWQTLNEPQPEAAFVDPDEIEHATMRQNYMTAVEYQLEMLADFILRNGDDNSLFILVGDHQPPAVSRRADGWSTPMHVIARDPALVDAFTAYGFVPGLRLDDVQPTMRHEGFYSLLMRVLLGRYGAGDVALPEYLPHGVTPQRLAQLNENATHTQGANDEN